MRSLNLNLLSLATRNTLLRFPLPMLSALVVTISLIFSVEAGSDHAPFTRLAMLAALCFIASLLVDLLFEATRPHKFKRLLSSAAVVLAVVAYGIFVIPEELKNSRPPFWYSHFILLFCLHLGVALVPLLASRDKLILWRFNLQLFLRYFFSSVNAALLYAGLALAIVSVDKLFRLHFHDHIYSQLWFVCAFFAHPLLFLSGIPRLKELTKATAFPKALLFSLRFIALPLTGLYLLILYTYVGKMAIQWSWPDGWVAMPIFILAVVSLLTFLLSVPLAKEEAWARFFHKWLFRLLLPLSIVLFLALQVRLADYGITTNRYLGLTLAVWLFAISATYILRPRLNVGWIPASLLLIALFAIVSGPVGAFGWSQRDQTEKLRELADQMGVLKDNVFSPANGSQDNDTVANFHSSLKYVFENFGPDALEAELQGFHQTNPKADLASSRAYSATNTVLAYLNLDSSTSQEVNYRYHGALPTFAHIWQISNNYYSRNHTRNFQSPHGKISLKIDSNEHTLSIRLDGETVAVIDTSGWAEQVIAAVDENGNKQSDPLTWHSEENNWRFSMVVTDARIERKALKINHLQYVLFYTPPTSNEKE